MVERRRFVRYAVAAGGLAALQVFWLRTQLGGELATTAFTDLVPIPVIALGAIACVRSGRVSVGRARHAWILLGASIASWGIGEIIWSYYELVLRREVPFPSFADIGYLGVIPLAAGALLAFPSAPEGIASRLRTLFDGLIIGGSVLFISWAFILGPLYRSGSGSVLSQVLTLAYPMGDVAIIAVVILTLARSPRGGRLALVLIGAGLLALALADSGFTYLILNESYSSGNLIDVGWTAAFLLIGLAAVWHVPELPSRRPEDRPTRVRVFLPYLPVVLAGVAASVRGAADGGLEPFLVWNGLAVIVIVIARQLLTLLENLALTRNLEAKVEARTAEVREREERFRSLVQNSSDVVTIIGPDCTIRYHTPSVERVFGHGPDERLGTNLIDLVHPQDRARVLAALAESINRPGADLSVECRVIHRDGGWRHTESTITNLVHDPSVRGVVLNTRDVSERRALEDQLMHQAFHDSLTGLANRALFRDRVDHALARGDRRSEPLAVLTLDLDSFKAINDSLGHGAGDRALAIVGERLSTCVRPGDTVARLGGDEFAVLLEGLDRPSDAGRVAERMLETLRTPIRLEGKHVTVAASVGVAVRASPDDRADDLLRNADVAMSMAKARGKARYEIFTPDMYARVLTRLELESDLRRAVERESFTLHYQPIVDLRTGAITGLEALLRWEHPDRGLVPPLEFIRIAEETGLIVPIGRWVLREACRQARRWQDESEAGPPIQVSVNISAHQLQQPDLVAQVAGALLETGLRSELLTLEITESVLLEDTEATIARLGELKALGVRLAIDDFGTGYSSLSYLRSFPADILKVDRSFVAGIGRGAEESALAHAIVRLGRTFHLETVAEGIERPEQLAELRKMGCLRGQGFYFARPQPIEEIRPLLGRSLVPVAG